MGNMANISGALVTVLTNIQQEGAAAFADIRPYPTLQMNGWPAATVTPADNLSEYESITENFRTYVFDVDLYYQIQQDSNGGYNTAFTTMLLLVDSVLDAIDNSNDLGNNCDIIRPAPSVWGMVQTSAGSALTAKVTVQCGKLVSQDNG